MNAINQCQHESRSPRFNLPVSHPPKWRVLLGPLLSAPMRLHRYRDFSRRIVEDTLNVKDRADCDE